VSPRFYSIVVQIIHQRLTSVTTLRKYELVFERFHPSANYITPYLSCDYRSADSLSENALERMGELPNLYTHFRLLPLDLATFVQRRRPVEELMFEDVPNTWLFRPSSYLSLASTTVSIDSHDCFTQLRAVVSLVKVGSWGGQYLRCVEVGGGTLLVWQDCTTSRVFCRPQCADENFAFDDLSIQEGKEPHELSLDGRAHVMWLDTTENIGLSVRVKSRKIGLNQEIMAEEEEGLAVSYILEYEGVISPS
jgi:hypothetical protein